MTKTLAAIINHNARAYTDQLYESLIPYKRNDYDIMVLDNGTQNSAEVSEYTTHHSSQNTYYGGALNLIFQEFLSLPEYDSLIVFNNDIILHGYEFVRTLREEMHEVTSEQYHWKILSPCVLQPQKNQCWWPTMHNWGCPTIRKVRWADFMCPLIHRDVVEKIKLFDNDLIFGWGPDIECGRICEENNWNIGVVDRLSVIHVGAATYDENRSDISSSEYASRAMSGMVKYFEKIGHTDTLNELRNWSRNYTFVS